MDKFSNTGTVIVLIVAAAWIAFRVWMKCIESKTAKQKAVSSTPASKATLATREDYLAPLAKAVADGNGDHHNIELSLWRDENGNYATDPGLYSEHSKATDLMCESETFLEEKGYIVRSSNSHSLPSPIIEFYMKGRNLAKHVWKHGDVYAGYSESAFALVLEEFLHFGALNKTGYFTNITIGEGKVEVTHQNVTMKLNNIITYFPDECYRDTFGLKVAYRREDIMVFLEDVNQDTSGTIPMTMLTPERVREIMMLFGGMKIKLAELYFAHSLLHVQYTFENGKILLLSSAQAFFDANDYSKVNSNALVDTLMKLVPPDDKLTRSELPYVGKGITWFRDCRLDFGVETTIYER